MATSMKQEMKLKVRYDQEVDILTISNGRQIATSSSIEFGLIADYGSEDGYDVVGIELMSAGKLIAPFCAVNPADSFRSQEIAAKIKSLKTNYDKDADILTISADRGVEFSFEVGDDLIAYMGYDDSLYTDNYDVVGIELRNASERLSRWFMLNRAPLAVAGGGAD